MKTLDELRCAWNAQADHMNQWDDLGIDEIVWWAQRENESVITELRDCLTECKSWFERWSATAELIGDLGAGKHPMLEMIDAAIKSSQPAQGESHE